MKKKSSSKSTKGIKKDYQRIMKNYTPLTENFNYQEWRSKDDSFKKFSLYTETRSGITTIESSITANF